MYVIEYVCKCVWYISTKERSRQIDEQRVGVVRVQVAGFLDDGEASRVSGRRGRERRERERQRARETESEKESGYAPF